MGSKPFWQSKTIWANVIMVLAVVLGFFGIDALTDVTVQAEVVAAIMGVVNVVLRFVTDKPVSV